MTIASSISEEDMHPDLAGDMEIMRQLLHLCIGHCETEKEVATAMIKAMRAVKNGHNEFSFAWPSLVGAVMHQELDMEGNKWQ